VIRRLLAAFLFAFPMLAGVVAAPEQPLSDPVRGPWAETQGLALASNGDLMLAVWVDSRASGPVFVMEVFAARITRDGAVLDPDGIALTRTRGVIEQEPHVSWDGTRFLVSWFRREDYSQWISTVSTDGVATPPVKLFSNALSPGFARNSGRTLTIFNRAQGVGILPSAVGLLRDDLTFQQTAALDSVGFPVIGSLGNGFVIAWMRQVSGLTYVSVQRMDANGLPNGPAVLLTNVGGVKGGFRPAMAESGSDVLIAIGDAQRLAIFRLRPDGTTAIVADLRDELFALYPAAVVARTDGSFDVLGHTSQGAAMAYRFSSTGAFLALAPLPANSYVADAVVSNGRVFATWETDRLAFGQFLYIGEPVVLISSAQSGQESVAITSNGSTLLAAWREPRAMHIVARQGDDPPVVIARTAIQSPHTKPAVVFDRNGWLLTWQDSRDATSSSTARLVLRRMSSAGSLEDEIVLSRGAFPYTQPVFATDGSRTLLIWPEGGSFDALLRLSWIDGDRIQTEQVPGLGAAGVVWNGERFFVVTRGEQHTIIGTFVDGPGRIGTPVPVSAPPLTEGDSQPAVAWSGERFLVTFLRHRDLYGSLLTRDGARTGTDFLIQKGAMTDSIIIHPQVAWDGTSFLAAANGTVIPVSSDGTVGAPLEVAVSGSGASILGLGRGAVVAYSRTVEELNGVPRVFTRRLVLPKLRAVGH